MQAGRRTGDMTPPLSLLLVSLSLKPQLKRHDATFSLLIAQYI